MLQLHGMVVASSAQMSFSSEEILSLELPVGSAGHFRGREARREVRERKGETEGERKGERGGGREGGRKRK